MSKGISQKTTKLVGGGKPSFSIGTKVESTRTGLTYSVADIKGGQLNLNPLPGGSGRGHWESANQCRLAV